MRTTIKEFTSKTKIWSVEHVDVRQALDELDNGVGPAPPYSEAFYERAIQCGAHDEWRVYSRNLDGTNKRLHTVYDNAEKADECMEVIIENTKAYEADED